MHFTAKISDLSHIAPDVCTLTLAPLPAGFSFIAGQNVILAFGGHAPRAYSIACAPDTGVLEFHIRNQGHGASHHVFTTAHIGDDVNVEGPYGTPPQHQSDRPLLFIAGGVGIAPIKSMIDGHIAQKNTAPLTLYWGARNAAQLYLNESLQAATLQYAWFSYTPVTEEKAPDCYHGTVKDALSTQINDLSDHTVFMAGPKAMIEATYPLLLEKKADQGYIFRDDFGI